MVEFNDRGQEIPDQTPVEMPAGFKKPESLTEQIRRLIRTEMSQEAVAEGKESWEDANDFDVDEADAELHPTEYEIEMQPEVPNDKLRVQPEERTADGGSGERSSRRSHDAGQSGELAEEPEREGTEDGGYVESDRPSRSRSSRAKRVATARRRKDRSIDEELDEDQED